MDPTSVKNGCSKLFLAQAKAGMLDTILVALTVPAGWLRVEPLLALANHPAHALLSVNPQLAATFAKTGNGWTSSHNARLGSFQMLSPALMVKSGRESCFRRARPGFPRTERPTCGAASFHKLWYGWRCAAFC